MQTTKTKVSKPRPNLVTADKFNAIISQLKAEMAQLRAEVEQLKQQPATGTSTFQMSPKMALRWAAIRAAKESLKAGSSLAATKALLCDTAEFQPLFNGDKDQAIEGIIKIALNQAGQTRK